MYDPIERSILVNIIKLTAPCCIGLLISQQAMSQEPKITNIKAAIKQMEGFDMRFAPPIRSDGRPNPVAVKRDAIAKALRADGPAAVKALAVELKSPELQMRKNAALMLDDLAGLLQGPKMDIKPALPALIEALSDKDFEVRVRSMSAIGSLGASANEAVPALKQAMRDKDAGIRFNAKSALAQVQGRSGSDRKN